ncbi:MAG: SGNH/GDSL hydrolase family protein [Elainella sp. Prado103]|jgi:lysophospholipase L1-like esterase|nr:SGNH/GDSL hydrolase family protein [Elainella sp. Prado103]
MNYLWISLGLATVIGLLELLLQLVGFGHPLLYLADPELGYLIAPNQQIRRFGKQITINQYSMRNSTISASRPAETLRILMIGDSIINGGGWTDQRETIPSLVQQQLQRSFDPNCDPNCDPQIEVLNASANSWSPRNQLAYLKRFGSFEAQAIVLVINTDDLFGTAPYSVVVGRAPNYPDRKPPSALAEALYYYSLKLKLLKPPAIPELVNIQSEPGDRVGANLAAIQQIHTFAQAHHAQFILAMTPLKREVDPSGSRDYERKARQRLNEFVQSQQINFIDFLPLFQALDAPAAIYHDTIHLNPIGNQQVSEHITQQINQLQSGLICQQLAATP